MDGNSAKNAPVLDHLVSTSTPQVNDLPAPNAASNIEANGQSKPVLTAMNATTQPTAATTQNNTAQFGNLDNDNDSVPLEDLPKNRRTDKSQFELELTKMVNSIMLKHFEHASEEIVQQVLSEVRARLPGQRKS